MVFFIGMVYAIKSNFNPKADKVVHHVFKTEKELAKGSDSLAEAVKKVAESISKLEDNVLKAIDRTTVLKDCEIIRSIALVVIAFALVAIAAVGFYFLFFIEDFEQKIWTAYNDICANLMNLNSNFINEYEFFKGMFVAKSNKWKWSNKNH